jgi:hypothetical protein
LRSIGLRQKQPAPTKRIEAAPCVHPADALMKPLPAALVCRVKREADEDWSR